MGVFEMNASTIKRLVSGTNFTIKKANYQAFTLQAWVDG